MSRYIRKAVGNIYNKKVDVNKEVDPDLFEGIINVFNAAVDKSTSSDKDGFADALKTNNGVYSAFRTHRMQNDMAAQMTDKNGQLKPFRQFRKDVEPIASHHIDNWLRTEYNTAVIRAHQAANWQQFEADRDIMPNLRWVPSTSANPSADHMIFWNTVRPVDDEFWSQHRPGDRWNCKCDLEATDEKVTVAPDGTPKDEPSPGLKNNPGKDARLFSDDGPFFPQSCASCPFGSSASLASGKKKDCYNCTKSQQAIPIDKRKIEKARAQFDAFSQKMEKTYFNEVNGGFLVTDKARIKASTINNNEKKKYEKEKNMCLDFANNGNHIVHLSEKTGISSCDVLCNGILADLKETSSHNNILDYASHATKHQGAKMVLFKFDKFNAKIASRIKKLQEMKIKGKYIVTGDERNEHDF